MKDALLGQVDLIGRFLFIQAKDGNGDIYEKVVKMFSKWSSND